MKNVNKFDTLIKLNFFNKIESNLGPLHIVYMTLNTINNEVFRHCAQNYNLFIC